MIMLISLWVLCGIISVMIANSKGERDLKVLIFCSLGGPVALTYVFMQNKKPKVLCSFCNAMVDPIGKLCSLCGLDLEASDQARPVVSMQCPRCGNSNVHDAFIENGAWGKWCPDCKMSIKKIRRSSS